MIPSYWTSTLANHLWQSTVVAAAAALLAFALRKNQARTRYWLWLAASIKFLIPFSLLIAAGSRLSWTAAAPIAQRQVSVVIGQITKPFPDIGSAQIVAQVAKTQHRLDLSTVLLGIWICGFVAVTFSWWRRWRRIRAVRRAASPINLEANMPVLSTPALLEPGVFGIFRPVLLLPEGITERLSLKHLKAIIAHELCHVRRRDNLAAVLHMAVEAIFWFHPLVWWIGSRMVEERERACDEEVLRLGSEPVVYAESILKTCQFYLESPLVCVSGITGSDLKKRIVRIMTQSFADKLSFSRKLLLFCAATVMIAVPVLFGLANASQAGTQSQTNDVPRPTFEVASIKPDRSGERRTQLGIPPGRFTASNVTVKTLIEYAYDIRPLQIEGGPSWIDSEKYDIEANTGLSTDDMRKRYPEDPPQAIRPMVQSLLADRFRLILSRKTKDAPIYELTVGKGGAKLHESTVISGSSTNPNTQSATAQSGPRRMLRTMRGEISMAGAPMSAFAAALSGQVSRLVVDKTGLGGEYDLRLQWAPDESQRLHGGEGALPDGRPGDDSVPPAASGPSIFTALQEQLGLKLESAKGPVEMLVISSIERPSEN